MNFEFDTKMINNYTNNYTNNCNNNNNNAMGQSLQRRPMNLLGSVKTQLQEKAEANRDLISRVRDHCQFVTLMTVGELDWTVRELQEQLKAQGLLRQAIKKEFNQVLRSSASMTSAAKELDLMLTDSCCDHLLPGYSIDFSENYSSVVGLLQARFHTLLKNDEEILFISAKQLFDDLHAANPTLCARIFMVDAMAKISIATVKHYRDMLTSEFGINMKIVDDKNIRTLISSNERISEMLPQATFSQTGADNLLKQVHHIRETIVSESVCHILEETEKDIYNSYIEFFIASLSKAISDKCSLPFTVRRTILSKFRSKKVTAEFLQEVTDRIPACTADEDVLDLSLRTPECHSPLLDEFRHMAFCGTTRLTSEEVVRMKADLLIREVHDNNGVLPMGTLRTMYADCGTKKGMFSIISAMGTAGEKTAAMLRTIKVEELKAAG